MPLYTFAEVDSQMYLWCCRVSKRKVQQIQQGTLKFENRQLQPLAMCPSGGSLAMEKGRSDYLQHLNETNYVLGMTQKVVSISAMYVFVM